MKIISYPNQQGTVLIVSLILLLLLTILAITASSTASLQERMAANAQESNIAFQAAESGLAELNRLIENGSTSEIDTLQSLSYPDGRTIRTRMQSPPPEILPGYSIGGTEVLLYRLTTSTTLDTNVTLASQIDDDNTAALHKQGYRDRIIKAN